MSTSTVTGKAQTTVPRAIREQAKIKPGDKLDWTFEGSRIIVTKLSARDKKDPLAKWIGYIKDRPGLTTDELMEELRGPAPDDDLR